jgi:heme-degrading monooxygenase HmoA
MWARVSTYQFPADNVDETLDRFSQALGSLEEPGLKRAELLVDRTSGKGMTITVWESEDALESSVEAANRLRSGAAGAAGASIVDVQHYELVRDEAF